MARTSKVDMCMLCGCTPCECNKPAPRAKAKAAPKKEPKPKAEVQPKADPPAEPEIKAQPPTQRRSALSAMKAQSKKPDTPVRKIAEDEVREYDDMSNFAAAIRNLGDMLAPEERERYSHILAQDRDDVKERRGEWLARTVRPPKGV